MILNKKIAIVGTTISSQYLRSQLNKLSKTSYCTNRFIKMPCVPQYCFPINMSIAFYYEVQHLQKPNIRLGSTMKRGTVPSWLELLLATQFFLTCKNHMLSSRSECNLFCIECEVPFCYHCRSDQHSTHRLLQVYYVTGYRYKEIYIQLYIQSFYMSCNGIIYNFKLFLQRLSPWN